ncbi:hypothetical protein FHW88_005626 [Mucilaginibacter sp. SG538B]|uniref:hypothetical protein n=1 Tax=Mucilaginibacter sp. SG538B TaxID=2587021 RepID=UPI00159DE8C0|nr:hypothetical protein [Mucilaginibacter sp. SG538B]NVM67305.1 hypothetical protein [Mucilaginibacter sp. SG538B]
MAISGTRHHTTRASVAEWNCCSRYSNQFVRQLNLLIFYPFTTSPPFTRITCPKSFLKFSLNGKGDTLQPNMLASKYPDMAIVVSSIGRTIKRAYITARANVLFKVDFLDKPLGISGCYNQLTIRNASTTRCKKIIARDLAGSKPVDITQKVIIRPNELAIPGNLIDKVV